MYAFVVLQVGRQALQAWMAARWNHCRLTEFKLRLIVCRLCAGCRKSEVRRDETLTAEMDRLSKEKIKQIEHSPSIFVELFAAFNVVYLQVDVQLSRERCKSMDCWERNDGWMQRGECCMTWGRTMDAKGNRPEWRRWIKGIMQREIWLEGQQEN